MNTLFGNPLDANNNSNANALFAPQQQMNMQAPPMMQQQQNIRAPPQNRNQRLNRSQLPNPDKNRVLPTDERSAFEEYLISGDVQQALSKLVAGTPAYLYLLYLDKMRSAEAFSGLKADEKS